MRERLYLACIEYGSVCLVKPRSIAFFEAILVSARYVDRTVAVGVGSYDGEVGQGRREVAGKFHADRRYEMQPLAGIAHMQLRFS